MAIDVSALTDYAWSDIAKAAKTAMITAALGGDELTINGRHIGRITVDDAKTLYDYATEQANAEASTDNGGGIALVKYGERV
jgi:hypothetical protein